MKPGRYGFGDDNPRNVPAADVRDHITPGCGQDHPSRKLLLYGGAIQLAGAVRTRRNQKATASDWMELEKERGISISSTLLQFDYGGCVVNLLDTPGHKDFSEDTYRVLTAVDSVVMVMDAAKGVEERTRKLFEICRLRQIPIFTFFNKLDRPARDPLALLDELEKVLGIGAFPVTWPLGSGSDFKGVYDRLGRNLHLYQHTLTAATWRPAGVTGIHDEAIRKLVPRTSIASGLKNSKCYPAQANPSMKRKSWQGSSRRRFRQRNDQLRRSAPHDYFILHGAPPAKECGVRPGRPGGRAFGFVFKVQANMNQSIRDCLTFVRVCSGVFKRNMTVTDPRTGKPVRLSYAKLFGQERESLETAYPGDIIGLVTHKPFRIGDTLATDPEIVYDEIPRFRPKCSLSSGTSDLAAQAIPRRHGPAPGGGRDPVVPHRERRPEANAAGRVGRLQFDVVLYRLRDEYGAEPQLEPAAFTAVRWFDPGTRAEDRADDYLGSGVRLATDTRGQLVILFPGDWALRYYIEKHPGVRLHATSPHAAGAPS